jgi:ribosomal protein L11 methyltransferase
LAEALRTWPALDVRAGVDLAASPAVEDHVALALDGLGATAVEHDASGHWRVYFTSDRDRARACEALGDTLGDGFAVTTTEVPDEGWATKVQAALRAVEVGRFIVCPPWDVPDTVMSGSRVIVIEPSTGFGTGHHQSTRLCLQALQGFDLAGLRVIDVGTGSGILAIAACLLGAADVLALDTDADAIDSACGNASLNAVRDRIELRVADLETVSAPPGHVVCANLTAALLRRLAGQLSGLVAPDGLLIASGFTADQLPLVTDAFSRFDMVRRDDEDDWTGVTFRRPR